MSDVVVVFTKSFPYGQGEQFLETEVKYLSRVFRRVVCVPQSVRGNRRNLPQGVEIDTSLALRPANRGLGRERFRLLAKSTGLILRDLCRRPRLLIEPSALRRLMVFCTQARIVENWTAAFIEVLGPNERSPLLYSYWLDVSSLGLVLVKKRTQDVSIVSRAHRFDLYEEARDPPYLPMQPFILSRLDVVFPISEHGRAYLLLQNPSLAPRCEVARLGVVDPGIRCAASGDSELRIVSCSLLKPVKRVDRLIDGIREVARFHPEIAIKWYHMGDGSLRSELERRASDRLPATVSWTFAGQISNEEVIAYYRTHPVDVFVNVSESEGIPVSIMEALSYGIPVIAPRVGGIPEAVNDANGVLLSHNPSPAEIGEALASFVEQGAVTIDQRRERSKDMWRRHFNADVNYVGFARRIRTLAT